MVVNPIISKILGRHREDLIGKLVFRRFLENIDPNLFARFVEVVESGEPLDEDFYYPLDDSNWYHYVAVKLGDGFAVTVRDITPRKQIELALQEANRKLELLANLDGLTQIANRRRFDDYLSLEWQRHQREQHPLALILIDIDYFKRYNDRYGHQGGDDCLIRVAQAIAQVPQRLAQPALGRIGARFWPSHRIVRKSGILQRRRADGIDVGRRHFRASPEEQASARSF